MTEYQIIYWREIPSMVSARAGRRDKASVQLSDRFQQSIDEAAMRIGLIGTADYMDQWRRGEWCEREGAPQDVAQAVAAELEAVYTAERLREMLNGSQT